MKLKQAFLAAALAVVPIAASAPASAVVVGVAIGPGHYRWHGGYYRYHWHGGYYNYYWHGRYWRSRWHCGPRWCYR